MAFLRTNFRKTQYMFMDRQTCMMYCGGENSTTTLTFTGDINRPAPDQVKIFFASYHTTYVAAVNPSISAADGLIYVSLWSSSGHSTDATYSIPLMLIGLIGSR